MSAISRKRIYFFANGIFSDQISGGDIHFFHMAQAAMDAGCIVHFFGGHALEKQLRSRFKDFELTLTDKSQAKPFNANSFWGQFKLLADYARRFIGSLQQISKIQREGTAYAVSDYWFDVWPFILCRAKRKLLIWHMQAPTLMQIISKSRADVDSSRVASLYYWASQKFSLWLFHFVKNKHVFFVHPNMRQQLLKRGYSENEMDYISFGVDSEQALKILPQEKIYDVVWIGRIHRQKGIEDLLAAFLFLKRNLKNFRALLIGNIKNELGPEIAKLGLEKNVEFSGYVSESEKFRLFKASRVFLMPSRFEGSPRVIGEALVCGIPVVAYDVETYRPIFGELIHYVPCFNSEAFQKTALETINDACAGIKIERTAQLNLFVEENSWKATCQRWLKFIDDSKPN